MFKKCTTFISISCLLITVFLTAGFTNGLSSPKTLYRVYLEGKSLGLIKSKKTLEKTSYV